MIIESSAPTRVDLAGGTIDIPPIFLFHEGASTVNFAVNLLTHCRIEPRDDNRIILESRDRGGRVETTVAEIEKLRDEPQLELLCKLVHFFRPTRGFRMITESEAPAGAGLAGSSALNIACIGALNKFVGDRYKEEDFIKIAANVETTVIKVPAGYQDYHPAQYGGAMAIHFGHEGIRREPLDVDIETLENRIALCYCGEPRNSGTNNWEITKRHIDGDKEIFEIFEKIRDTALEMRETIAAQDWNKIGELLRAAFPTRKRLSPNITTPQMDLLISKAHEAGAVGAKVCGAGGGGCIAFFCEEGKRQAVEKVLAETEGAEVLNWKFAPEGLQVKVTESHSV